MSANILIVDDERSLRLINRTVLEGEGYKVFEAGDGEEALEKLSENWIDLVTCDIRMPRLNGIGFLKRVKEEFPRVPVLMISAFGHVEKVVEAMKMGAQDFLEKPVDSEELLETIEKLLNLAKTEDKSNLAPLTDISSAKKNKMIGETTIFKNVVDLASKASLGDASVMIHGESGTGKEVMAKFIHESSPRREGPFVAVNCGALPENLIESELFGHEKGAFTGAQTSKPGKFELANGGTLFLDEIGEIPLLAQVKLLRVLQERVVDRVGGIASRPIDIRIICATHKDLPDSINEGSFREDLYYRLNVIPLEIPALRERQEDVILLAKSILSRLSERYSIGVKLDFEAQKKLMSYGWPGNVRELENVLERSLVMSTGGEFKLTLPIQSSSAPVKIENANSTVVETINSSLNSLAEERAKSEKQVIENELSKNRWNRTRTAEALGVSRRTLLYKIKAYGIN
jgi:DNA-binding NtrC family response regulator